MSTDAVPRPGTDAPAGTDALPGTDARCSAEELRGLFLFEGLTDDQLGWLCRTGRVVVAEQAGVAPRK